VKKGVEGGGWVVGKAVVRKFWRNCLPLQPTRAARLLLDGRKIEPYTIIIMIKSCEGQNFDIILQLYHPLKNDIKISLSSKK
jgi:hypothetical protein